MVTSSIQPKECLMLRKLLSVFILILALLSVSLVSLAGADSVIDYDPPVVNCNGASLTFYVPPMWTNNWLLDVDGTTVNSGNGTNFNDFPVGVTATNVGGIDDPFPFAAGTHTVSFFVSVFPGQSRGDARGTPLYSEIIDCDEDDDDDDTPVLMPGRVCFGPGEVAAAVYVTGTSVEIWTINNDLGELAIKVSKDDLYDEWTPGTAVLAAETDLHIHVELWVQANGFIRVLAGPDDEGKLFECVFGGRYSRVRSYFPGQVGPDELVPEEPEPTPTPSPTQTPV
jgi:hypothetical protein